MTPEEKSVVDQAIGQVEAAAAALAQAKQELETLEVDEEEPPPEPEPEPLPEHPELAARTSGVAPLCVFFDSGAEDIDFLEARHDWDFGDPQSGTWAHTGKSKNAAQGPITGHVYETPGTYVAVLDEAKQVTITVEDPDAMFAGDKTVCFSQTGDFTGAPAGATTITTGSLQTVASHLAAGRRLLLRRGESWNGGAVAFGGQLAGPGIIGAFGSGERPIINTTGTLFQPRWSDWRIMDLEVRGPGTGDTRALRTTGYCEQMLVLRCLAKSTKSGWIFSTSQLPAIGPLYDQCSIVDSGVETLVGGSGGNGSMFAGRRALFAGNHYDDCSGVEHVVRAPWLQACAIVHNDLGKPASTKHVLKLHGPPWDGSALGNHAYTERIHVAHNTFRGGLASWVVASAPEDNHTDQRVRCVLVEGNTTIAGPEMQNAYQISCVGFLARNNVVDGTGGKGCTAFSIGRRGVEPIPEDIKLLHNTVYTADPDRFVVAAVGSGIATVEVRGNLGSAPNSTNKAMLTGTATFSDNLLSDTAGFVNAGGGDFHLQPSSPAAGQAPAISQVWDDKDGAARDMLTAIGAYEVV